PPCRSRKTRWLVPFRSTSSLRWRCAQESPTAPSPRYRNCSQYRPVFRLLPHSSGSIQRGTRCGMIRASRNSARKSSTEATNQRILGQRGHVGLVEEWTNGTGGSFSELAPQVIDFRPAL